MTTHAYENVTVADVVVHEISDTFIKHNHFDQATAEAIVRGIASELGVDAVVKPRRGAGGGASLSVVEGYIAGLVDALHDASNEADDLVVVMRKKKNRTDRNRFLC